MRGLRVPWDVKRQWVVLRSLVCVLAQNTPSLILLHALILGGGMRFHRERHGSCGAYQALRVEDVVSQGGFPSKRN